MLINYDKEWSKKKSPSNDSKCHFNCHNHHQKSITLTSSFFIQLFIASTIMASSPDSSVAINILNDRIHVREILPETEVQMPPKSIEEQKIFLNENQPLQNVDVKGQVMTPLGLKTYFTVTKITASRDKSKYATSSIIPLSCSSTNRKLGSEKNLDKLRKHKEKKEYCLQKTDHVKSATPIFGGIAIKNGTQFNQHVIPIQSSETDAKFKKKLYNQSPMQLSRRTIFKRHNFNRAKKQIQIYALANSHDIGIYPEMNSNDFKETDAVYKQIKINASLLTTNAHEWTMQNHETIVVNDSDNRKRKTRSVTQLIPLKTKRVTKWQATQRDTNDNKATEIDSTFDVYKNTKLTTLNLLIKPVEEGLVTNTLNPINDRPNNSNTDMTSCHDANDTCVGEPEYCNLTEVEYFQMLYDYIFPTPGEWVLIGFHAAVFLVGLIGNILVCIAVYANATMRTVTNIFIVNLAIADLLVIILCLPPTVVWDVTETWFLGEAMCKGILYLQTVSVTVSVLTLTFISIDRWYAICFPLRYVSTNGRAWCSIGLIWIGALLSDIPEFINSTTKKKELRFGIDLFTQCVSTWDKDTEKNFYIFRFGALYVLPLILMSIAYFKIICVLWKSDTIPGHRESCKRAQTIHARNNVGNSSTMSQLRARRKAAKMLVVVVVMFAICYLPVHCLNILRYTIDIAQNEVIAILSLISHWLCYANSAVNPLIYNFMSGKFRREFVSVLERCRCSNHEIHRHHSCYFNTPTTRLNTVSPNTRSLCHFVSQRERNKSFREKNTIQTSFIENVCSIYPNGNDHDQEFDNISNGLPLTGTVPNSNKLHSPKD